MLKVLDFQLVQPTIRTFMTRFLEISHLDAHSDQIEYLSNVSLAQIITTAGIGSFNLSFHAHVFCWDSTVLHVCMDCITCMYGLYACVWFIFSLFV